MSQNLTLNNCNVFTHSNFALNHRWLLTNSKQVKNVVVILLTLNESGSHFADFEQVEKLNSYFAVNSWAWLLLDIRWQF